MWSEEVMKGKEESRGLGEKEGAIFERQNTVNERR